MTVLLVVVGIFVAYWIHEFEKRTSLADRLSNLNSEETSEFRELWKLWSMQNLAEGTMRNNQSIVPIYKPQIREELESRAFLRQALLESQAKFTRAHETITPETEHIMGKRRSQ
jgi:hypothetical protein